MADKCIQVCGTHKKVCKLERMLLGNNICNKWEATYLAGYVAVTFY